MYCVRFLIFISSFLLISTSLKASTQEEGKEQKTEQVAQVKVLLKKNIDGALIEVKGAYQVIDPFSNKSLSSGSKGKRFYLYSHKGGIKWGEEFPGIYQVKIIPTSPSSSVLVDGVQYKGNLEIYNVDQLITVINEVDVENYLKSTLAPRFANHIQDVVMDSLAIVARTNVYYQIAHSKGSFWHVIADETDYRGFAATRFNSNLDRAIDNTKYLVMTYEKRPFATTWNENCAGKTASYQSIFRKNVTSPGGIKSAFAERARKEHHWSFSVPKAKIAKLAQTNRVSSLELYIDSNSEKVYAIRVQDGSHHKEIDFLHLQQGLGKSNLLSNDFTVSLEGNNVVFDGFGEGCSVGLCIYSATQMAKRGDTAPEILATFYPYSHIEQIRCMDESLNPKEKITKKQKKEKIKEARKAIEDEVSQEAQKVT